MRVKCSVCGKPIRDVKVYEKEEVVYKGRLEHEGVRVKLVVDVHERTVLETQSTFVECPHCLAEQSWEIMEYV